MAPLQVMLVLTVTAMLSVEAAESTSAEGMSADDTFSSLIAFQSNIISSVAGSQLPRTVILLFFLLMSFLHILLLFLYFVTCHQHSISQVLSILAIIPSHVVKHISPTHRDSQSQALISTFQLWKHQ